jgi:hypothetical protein
VTAKFDEVSSMFEIVTYKEFKRGEECFISYGPHDNAFLLAEYGFTLGLVLPHCKPANPYDFVSLDEEIADLKLKGAPLGLRDQATAELQLAGLWGDYSLRFNEEPSFRLLNALRLYSCTLISGDFGEKLAIWKRVLQGSCAIVSEESEEIVNCMLDYVVERAKQRYQQALCQVEKWEDASTKTSSTFLRVLNQGALFILENFIKNGR